MSNIIHEITKMISSNVIKEAAQSLGESESGISKAISGLAPTLLAGMISKTKDPKDFSGIFDMITNQAKNLDLDGSSILGSSANKTITDGLMGMLFGNKTSGIFDLITSFAGLKKGSSSSIMSMVAPFALRYLAGKVIKGGLNPLSMANFLKSQGPDIAKALPGGMEDVIGFSAKGVTSKASGGGNNLAKYLLPLLLIAGAIFAWRSCGDDVKKAAETTVETVSEVTGDAITATGEMASDAAGALSDAVANLGAFFTRKLANGLELNIPELGVENKLIDFIEGSTAISNDTWFNFDRLTFETGSANLDNTKSKEQLDNIAAILKAYPGVSIKLGGYTDNTGDAATNLTLSQARADNVVAALVARGIDASRLSAEGYGSAHPVASNDTEEGRAQNRRIAISVRSR